MILLLLLAAVPPPPPNAPSSVGVRVFQSGVDAGIARSMNFVGATVGCDAGSAYCTVTVTGGGGGAPTNASYLTEVPEAGLSAEFAMSSLATGLVKNTTATGVPSIYAGTSCTNQFPRSLNASGAATCSSVALGADVSGALPVSNGGTGAAPASDDQVLVSDSSSAATWRSVPNCTDTAGQHLNYTASTNGWSCGTSATATAPGGSSPQLQYNNSGAFGGIANVQSDGTRLNIVAETAVPTPPTGSKALHYDFSLDSGFPSMPNLIDAFMSKQMPTGVTAIFDKFSSTENWEVSCAWPEAWGQSTMLQYNERGPSLTGTASGVAWASTSLLTRSKVVKTTSGTFLDTWIGLGSGSFLQRVWRGNTSGAGGWLFWTRDEFVTTKATSRHFIGLSAKTSGFANSADPSTEVNTVYFGCNSGDTNLSICSNDNSGSATCTTLGASFPCTTSGAYYDFWLTAPPNGSVINYYIERLDSAAQASGSITSDLPQNTVQLNWQVQSNTGSTNTTAIAVGFMGECILANN